MTTTTTTATAPLALARGGLWLRTPLGALQLGAPPETLKDTMPIKDGVPRIVVLPRTLVDVRKGLPTADLEFPIYWNLFVRKRPLIVIGTADQRARVQAAVQEALLGPVDLDLRTSMAPGRVVPDLAREHRWFRRGEQWREGLLHLEDALTFLPFAAGSPALIREGEHEVEVALDVGAGDAGSDAVCVRVDGGARVRMNRDAAAQTPTKTAVMSSTDPELAAAIARAKKNAVPFLPPRFGVTVLGRSHGFDPDPRERTTGFILWVGGRGVLVDPPVHSTSILREADIDASLVDSVVLTHVHGDHDSGVLQKALEAGRVTLHTAPVIFQSWLRKWSALSAIPEAELAKLIDFRPVQIGRPVDIHGANLLFRFTLHSIPAIAFEAHYEGASFNYSGDTLNDPAAIDAMFKAGFMDPSRREQLTHFDWSHDIVFHESGTPPLHTPLDVLVALDDDIKRRLRVLHVTPERLKNHKDLLVAEPGRAHTLELPVEPPPELKVLRHITLLGRTRLFSHLPLGRAAELIGAAKELHLKAGEQLMREGTEGDTLYVITGGKCSLQREGREIKVYGLGDYLGENAVFLQTPRFADVYALTNIELLAIDGAVARRVCKGTDIPAMVARHAEVRRRNAWALLEDTDVFAGMTTTQKNAFETLLVPFDAPSGTRLLAPGVVADHVLLMAEGKAIKDGDAFDDLDHAVVWDSVVCGDLGALLGHKAQPAGVTIVSGPARGFFLPRADLAHFLDENPGVRVRIEPWTAHTDPSLQDGYARMVTEHVTGHPG